jgi:DNA-binding response OmpR family regulator
MFNRENQSQEEISMLNILVVEDDIADRELFCSVLQENGFTPIEACDGIEALKIMDKQYIDLVISDIIMPNMDGYELTRQIRSTNPTIPILMITVNSSAYYKQEGFQAGTDDYMVKPIDVNEMIWRVKALLRRSQNIHDKKYTLGSTSFLSDSFTVICQNRELILPPKEFKLLYKLVSTPNRTFTRMQLMDEVWGYDSDATTHTLEVHIGRLREKFKDNPDFKIVTVRGLGYKAVIK